MIMCFFIHLHECVACTRGRAQEPFVEFHLLSLTCVCYVRGFSLWTAVLIADGVVLGKYLVTADERWESRGG